jgi:hypothetical protein
VSRERALVVGGLAGIAALSALVVGILAWGGGRETEPTPRAEDEPAIEARGVLVPEVALFGDTVRARVEVTLDRSSVDPDSVRIQAGFTPWEPVGNPVRARRDAEGTTYIQSTFVLRCVVQSCISTADRSVQDFPQAHVTYTTREGVGTTGRQTLPVQWPSLVVGSRSVDGQGANRWRAELLSLPAVSYRFGPGLLLALLLAGGLLLAGASGALLYRAFPRPADEPKADVPPVRILTPLERAFELLEDPARVDGAVNQRRALEFVATMLAERGDVQLAQAARALAWSQPLPAVERTSGLSARARSALAAAPEPNERHE